jgi:hypothetical protein
LFYFLRGTERLPVPRFKREIWIAPGSLAFNEQICETIRTTPGDAVERCGSFFEPAQGVAP